MIKICWQCRASQLCEYFLQTFRSQKGKIEEIDASLVPNQVRCLIQPGSHLEEAVLQV